MITTILVAVIAISIYQIYSYFSGLQRNLSKAKSIGLPYIVSPISTRALPWLLLQGVLIPLIQKFPRSWWEEWLPYTRVDWTWELLYDGFKQHGDIIVLVTPSGLTAYLADAEAIRQVTSRREAFPKLLTDYKILDIFGRNILSTEGAEWKEHRRVTAPGFNEKNNVLVFSESTRQAESMIKKWLAEDGKSFDGVPTDTNRLTLHIITRIGFGVSLLWPGETPAGHQSVRDAELSSSDPPEGHSMSFENALSELLEYLFLVLMLPKWLLKIMPFKPAKIASEAYSNWKQYMDEMFVSKIEDAREGKVTEGMDIMGSLVRSSYGDDTAKYPGQTAEKEVKTRVLSDSDILGNAFVMILAGHETTANSIHFSLMELAMNPSSQRALQEEIAKLLGNTPSSSWDYDTNMNALLGGMCGAVLNEQLRLMPPVIAIPKHVTQSADQSITVGGKKYILPIGTKVNIATPNVHRNPKYWPTRPSTISGASDDLDDFRPERWLVFEKEGSDSGSESTSDDEFGGFTGRDAHAKLFRPVRGSYLPFSDGPRSCLGRRLAQVKIMAVLAVIFQTCSIELAVDQWASDDEIAQMTAEEKRAVYRKAQDAARATIRTATARITLKLHPPGPTYIPVRIVKKGTERFVNFI